MNNVLKYDNFNKINILFLKEHEKFLKKNNINIVFLNSVKLPFIYLYEIVDELFKNNLIFLQKSEIILLTILSISVLTKDNKIDSDKMFLELDKKKKLKYLKYVKYTIKSLKNIFNIVLKKETIILNIEQAIKHKNSIKIFYSILEYIKDNKIEIKSFYNWFLVNNYNYKSNKMLKNIEIEYLS